MPPFCSMSVASRRKKEVDRIKPVLESIPEARLALVGDGPYREELEKHFADTHTHFVGYLAGEALGAAYASADAFVFPSRTETLGLVLLEAMAAGCPVVAANAGGHSRYCREWRKWLSV